MRDRQSIDLFLNSESRSHESEISEFWLLFLSLVEFVDEPILSAELAQYIAKIQYRMPAANMPEYTPLDTVRIALWKSVTRDSVVTWGDICKTFLVMNFAQEDPSSTVTKLIQGSAMKPLNTGVEMGMQVARHLMGVRNSANEHEETLVTLLTTYLKVDTAKIAAMFRTHEAECLVRCFVLCRSMCERQ